MGLKSFYFQCKVFICLLALTSTSTTWAISYSNIYIFGDSLSDTDAGASNGPLWPEYLAPQLGLSYNPGSNFSVAGAFSIDLATQISIYQATISTVDANALYVVWAGGNDINLGLNGVDAANNVISAVDSLSALGASHFLIPNMPDLGMLPIIDSSKTPQSIDFNSTIDLAYAGLSSVAVADIFGLHHEILDDPAAFGFADVTNPCSFTVCVNPDEYLWWDFVHPTTAGHSLLADEFAGTLATIPVPAAIWLFGSGLIGLIGIARRKRS